MSFLEVLSIVLSAAGLFALILGACLAVASRHNGEATRALIRSMEERMTTMLERMDQRADERHREVIDAMRTLRT